MFKIALLYLTLCIVTNLTMAVFKVTTVEPSDLTFEAPHFLLFSIFHVPRPCLSIYSS